MRNLPLHLQQNISNMKRFFLAALSIAAVGFTGTTQAQSSGKLVIANKAKYAITNVVKSTTNMEMMGQSMDILADMTMLYNLDVTDVQPNKITVGSALIGMKMNTTAMGQNMTFDSDKKEDLDGDIGKAVAGEFNKVTTVEFNDNAQILSTKKEAAKESAEGAEAGMSMIKNMGSMADDGTNGASMAFLVIPSGINVGNSWADSSVKEELKVYRNYTLTALNGNEATVTLTGKQNTHRKTEQNGMEFEVNMESKMTGNITLDISTGIIKQKTISMDGTGATEVMGQSMPMTTKVTITTTVAAK